MWCSLQAHGLKNLCILGTEEENKGDTSETGTRDRRVIRRGSVPGASASLLQIVASLDVFDSELYIALNDCRFQTLLKSVCSGTETSHTITYSSP